MRKRRKLQRLHKHSYSLEEKDVENSHFCREIYKANFEITNTIVVTNTTVVTNTIVTNTEVAIGKHSFYKCYVNSVRSMKYVKNLLLHEHSYLLYF